jgi:hypothetical protein
MIMVDYDKAMLMPHDFATSPRQCHVGCGDVIAMSSGGVAVAWLWHGDVA